MEIGGFFSYEDICPVSTDFIHSLCPNTGDINFLMSGRCAIYFCLQDSMLTDQKRVAYLPAYICETVMAGFIRANYRVIFYDVDKHLCPHFDPKVIPEISFLLICGWYGYSTYDSEFVAECQKQGVTVMQDITQTAFSANGVCPYTDYVVCSMRKWMGVPAGGIAIKRNGTFKINPEPANELHLNMRREAMTIGHEYRQTGNEELNKKSFDTFWQAEMMLRQIFNIQEGDRQSIEIMCHYPVQDAVARHRENYQYLISHLPKNAPLKPFFTDIPDDTCPMYFAFLCNHRQHFKDYLKDNGILANIYWPVPPFIRIENYPMAHYVYNHVMSVCCDQRYSLKDMQHIIDVLSAYVPPVD